MPNALLALSVRMMFLYFMHYDVNRDVLHELVREIEALAEIERAACFPEQGGCQSKEAEKCHNQDKNRCSNKVKEFCHGHNHDNEKKYLA